MSFMEQNPSTPQPNILTPAPPPKKKSRKKLIAIIIAVVVIVIVIIAVIGAVVSNNNSGIVTPLPKVNVTAVDLSIVYNGLSSGYLGPTSQSLPGFTTVSGSSYSYTITFTSSAAILTHSITSIYTNTPGFSITSVSPTLPYSFSPGSTFTVTIIIQTPTSSYDGVLQITVETS